MISVALYVRWLIIVSKAESFAEVTMSWAKRKFIQSNVFLQGWITVSNIKRVMKKGRR